MKLPADLSTETLQARKEWQKIFQVMKSKRLQPRLLYPVRLSIKMEGEKRTYPKNKRLKEHISTKSALQEMIKGLL